MTPFRSPIAQVAALLTTGFTGAARLPAQQVALPPVRQLGRRLAISKDTIGNVFGIRQLRDGRVIVNDVGDRRLLLLDSTLTHATVIADSTGSTKKAYGSLPGGLLASRADTTLFVDPIALSMLVIDPNGTIIRTEAPPRPKDAGVLVQAIGNASVDANGRVLYRGIQAMCGTRGCGYILPNPRDTSGDRSSSLPAYARHDSTAILRGDISTHVIDTVGFVAIANGPSIKNTDNPDGSHTMTWTVPSLLPIADDWAVVADGSVAFVRGQDYHVDWVNADGSRTSTPKVAHDWHRLTDSEKTAIIESAKRIQDSTLRVQAEARARADSINKASGRPVGPKANMQVYVWPEPSDLPDYRPMIAQGAVSADADDNLWIRPMMPTAVTIGRPVIDSTGPPVYDIVSRQGTLVDRVQLPPQMALAGFGPGVVYLTVREGSGTVIAKYRIH